MGASAYGPAGLAGLVLLFPALLTALYCDSLPHHQQILNAQILQLLAKQGLVVPPECLAQMTAFHFPAKDLKVEQAQLARRAASEILRGYLGLLISGPGWAATIPERLLNDLYAQSQRIKKCLSEEKTEPRSPDDERRNQLILQRYFRRIRTFLQEKSHSPCTGIIMQTEARTCLTYLDMLTNRMNS